MKSNFKSLTKKILKQLENNCAGASQGCFHWRGEGEEEN